MSVKKRFTPGGTMQVDSERGPKPYRLIQCVPFFTENVPQSSYTFH